MSAQAILEAINELDSLQRAQLVNTFINEYLPDDDFVMSDRLERELDKVEENWQKNPSSTRPFREVMNRYLAR